MHRKSLNSQFFHCKLLYQFHFATFLLRFIGIPIFIVAKVTNEIILHFSLSPTFQIISLVINYIY